MKDLKVGDKVRCIKAHSCNPCLKVGREYIVQDILTCCQICINVGLPTTGNSIGTNCSVCSSILTRNNESAFSIRLFEKAEEQYRVVKIEAEILEEIENLIYN